MPKAASADAADGEVAGMPCPSADKVEARTARKLVQENASWCVVFAAGLLLMTVTINLGFYMSLKQSIATAHMADVVGPRGLFANNGNPHDNIVRIEAHYGSYSRTMPWQMIPAAYQPMLKGFASGATASGVILGRGLILTSAYVATDSVMITATRQGDATKYQLHLVAIARDLDLAILDVKDPKFWSKEDMAIEPRADAPIPALGTEVIVAGFPAGSELSIAKVESRISRVEAKAADVVGRYNSFPSAVMALHPKVHELVAVGPAFNAQTGTFAGFVALNNRVVPERTIAAFVNTVRKTGGFPSAGMLGLVIRSMRPPALRKYWGLPQDDVGVQVRSVASDSPLVGKVQTGDFLTHVAGQPVHADGAMKINVSEGTETVLPFQVFLGEKAAQGPVKLKFRRSKALDTDGRKGFGETKDFEVEEVFTPLQPLAKRTMDTKALDVPSYFVAGGFVWTIFTEDLVAQSAQLPGGVIVPPATLAEALYRWRSNPDEEVVVLLRRLEHPCNKFYDTGGVRVLRYFNDEPVVNLKTFVQKFGAAVKSKERFLRLAFAPMDDDDAAGGVGDPDIVLDVERCAGADMQLGRALAIQSPVSLDLMEVYAEAMPKEFIAPQPTGRHLPVVQAAAPKEATNEPAQKPLVPAAHVLKEEAGSLEYVQKDLPWANVVQVTMTVSERDFLRPWQMGGESAARCSGIIMDVKRRLIITNSHCVASSEVVFLQREDFPEPIVATVVEIARDMDLAVLTTEDAGFWANLAIRPVIDLDDARLPYLSSRVRVVGYPMGGKSITITEGIVSRLDGQIYPNGLLPSARGTPDNLVIVQVDAAINHGNSGGPVFDQDGRLLGLAFAALASASNVGYVIPSVLVRNFLQTVEKGGRWLAQPEIGVMFKKIQNDGIRHWLRLQEHESGIQARSVAPLSPISGAVQKGDVLLTVDGMKVDGQGTLKFDVDGKEVSLPFDIKVTQKAPGEYTKMEFLRVNTSTGERQMISINEQFHPVKPLVARFDDSPMPVKGRERFAAEPTYFVFSGLVWGIFSTPMLTQLLMKKMLVPWSVQKLALHQWLKDDEEVVVLLKGLPHRCIQDYDVSVVRVLRYFNGEPVKTMRDFVHQAGAATQANEEYMRFTFYPLAAPDLAGGVADPDIVLHRPSCANVDKEVTMQNGIPAPGVSASLYETYADAFGLPKPQEQQIPPELMKQLKAVAAKQRAVALRGQAKNVEQAVDAAQGALNGAARLLGAAEAAHANLALAAPAAAAPAAHAHSHSKAAARGGALAAAVEVAGSTAAARGFEAATGEAPSTRSASPLGASSFVDLGGESEAVSSPIRRLPLVEEIEKMAVESRAGAMSAEEEETVEVAAFASRIFRSYVPEGHALATGLLGERPSVASFDQAVAAGAMLRPAVFDGEMPDPMVFATSSRL